MLTLRSTAVATALLMLATTDGVSAQEQQRRGQRPQDQAAFFGLDKLWDVRLTVSEKGWKSLFPTTPSRGISNLGRFDYVKVRAEIAGHVIQEAGLRFKGNSTFMFTSGTLKRPFKIDFDRYNKKQEFLGLTKLNLNNNATDPTQIREAISYQAYRDAGVMASRTCFARVFLTIKGRIENEYLGMYTIVEQVDRRLLKQWFGSKKGLLVKPERRILPHLGETWNERYDASYHPKTTVTSEHAAPLIGLAGLLEDNDSKAFAAGIAKVLDIDQFLNYVGVSVIIANLDSPLNLPHNYYLAVPDDSRRVVWIPWDLNLSLAGFTLAGSRQAELSVMDASKLPLLNRVLDIASHEDKYKEHLRKLIEGCCSAKTLTTHIKTARATTGAAIQQEQQRSKAVIEADSDLSGGGGMFGRWGRNRGRNLDRLFRGRQTLEEFVVAREQSVRDQLDGKSQGRRAGFGFGWGNRGGNRDGGFGGLFTREDSSTRMRAMVAASDHLPADQDSFTVAAVKTAAGKLFAQLDTDTSAGLDGKEIAPALLRLPRANGRRRSPSRARSLASRHARRMVRELDTNRDGKLTVAEWLTGVDSGFPRWDTNKDGSLDREELAGGELAGRGSRR
ncbi:MAG: CotH kinase family protein [Planctomycetota bacterium]